MCEIMKKKRRKGAEIGNGPLPNCVTIKWELYLDMVGWKAGLAWGEAVS